MNGLQELGKLEQVKEDFIKKLLIFTLQALIMIQKHRLQKIFLQKFKIGFFMQFLKKQLLNWNIIEQTIKSLLWGLQVGNDKKLDEKLLIQILGFEKII
jgi:hypothetical protein